AASSHAGPTIFSRRYPHVAEAPQPSLPSPHIRSRPRRRRTVRVARLRTEYVRSSQPAHHPRIPRQSHHRHREREALSRRSQSSSRYSLSSSRQRSRHSVDDRAESVRRRRPSRRADSPSPARRLTLADVARNLATYWIEEKGRLDEPQMTRPASMVAVRPP